MSDSPCKTCNVDNEPIQSGSNPQPMRWVFESVQPENESESGNQEVVVTCLDKLKSDLIEKFDAKMRIYADVICQNTRTLRSQSSTTVNQSNAKIEELFDRVEKLEEKFQSIDTFEAKLKEIDTSVIAMEATFDCRLKEQLMQWIWKGCPSIPCSPEESRISEPFLDPDPCESPPYPLQDPFNPSTCPPAPPPCAPKLPHLHDFHRPSGLTDPCRTPCETNPCRTPPCMMNPCRTPPCAIDPCVADPSRKSPYLTDSYRPYQVPSKSTTADRPYYSPPPECCSPLNQDPQRSNLSSSARKPKGPQDSYGNFR